jgi:hypothetical protein
MKFTKAQYDHMSATFRWIIKAAVSTVCLPEPKAPTYEEYAGMINNGEAKINLERVFQGGSCPYYFKEMLQYFDFPGQDELEAKKQIAAQYAATVNEKLWHYLSGLLDKFVVGMIEDGDILGELERIEHMPEPELRKFIDSLKMPKQPRNR